MSTLLTSFAKNLFVKSNMSGDFTQINTFLVEDLKRLDLWDDEMLDDLKYYDGSLLEIERIPDAIKQRYLTAFEVDPAWLIEAPISTVERSKAVSISKRRSRLVSRTLFTRPTSVTIPVNI